MKDENMQTIQQQIKVIQCLEACAHNKSQSDYCVWIDILLVLDATVQRTVMSCNAIFKCMKIKCLDTNKVQVPKKMFLHF